MRSERSLIIFGGMALLWVNCSPRARTSEPEKAGRQQITAAGQDASKGEQIDIPANIAGSYLTCALRQEAKNTALEAQYGCRLTDEKTEKKLDTMGLELSWAANIQSGVRVQPLANDAIYHAYYYVSGTSLEAIGSLVQDLEVIASLRLNAGDIVPVKREKVVAILKPALVLEDFEAPIVREQSIQVDDAGSL